MMIRLRQATGWTGIISDKVQESAKMDRMIELVQEIVASGQKAIIFSNWESITEVARDKLKSYNINSKLYYRQDKNYYMVRISDKPSVKT